MGVKGILKNGILVIGLIIIVTSIYFYSFIGTIIGIVIASTFPILRQISSSRSKHRAFLLTMPIIQRK
jgi:hypothetical protein